MNLPIVIAAYNRPKSLTRLLNSLENANYPKEIDVDLIISLDYSGNNKCLKIASDYKWPYGNKRIIHYDNKLGLKQHIIRCGDFCYEYDGIVLLEDDLIVSPAFYYYAIATSSNYSTTENIAGISLYGYEINEFCDLPFAAIRDGKDTFFMKVPSSWGQIFLRNHWLGFKKSLKNGLKVDKNDFLPEDVISLWPETSWKKLYFKHIVENDLYFIYPLDSYSSNMGDRGVHFDIAFNSRKTNLSLKKENFNFPNFNETINIYDQFMEWEPEKIAIQDDKIKHWAQFEIDITGNKQLCKIKKSKIITSRKVSDYIEQIPINVHPIHLNLLINNHLYTDISNTNLNITSIEYVLDDSSIIKEYFASCICPIPLGRWYYNQGVNATKNSRKYKLGKFLLRPFEFIIAMFK